MRARYRFLLRSMVQEWRTMFRHPTLLLVLVAIPVVYPLVVSWLYQANQAVERPTVVIDDDNSALSRELLEGLDASQELRVIERAGSVDEGWRALRERRAEVLVYVPSNLSTRVKRGEQAHVKVWVDSSNILTYGVAYPGVSIVVSSMNDELAAAWMRSKGVSREVARARVSPVARVERMAFHPTLAYGAFLVPGVLLLVMQQAVLIALAFSAGLSRELGEPAEAKRWPFTWLEGKFLAHLASHLGATAFIVLCVFRWFGWPMRDAVSLLGLFAVFVLTVAPAAVLVSSLVKDRYASFQLLMFASAPMFLMSGFSWPIEQMPAHVRAVATLLPSTPALGALRVLAMKSGDPASATRWLVWMAVSFVGWTLASLIVSRRAWRPWVARVRARAGRTG